VCAVPTTTGESTTPIRSTELQRVRAQVVDDRTKGIPPGAKVAVNQIGEQGWNVVRGDMAFPILTIGRKALEGNLQAMQEYCARCKVHLAPHGKTTMSPDIFERQLAHGAWGMTAATPTQVATMRRFGVPRILLANELVDPAAIRWVSQEMSRDPHFEVVSLVDDVDTVLLLERVVRDCGGASLPVLLEVGQIGGRTGVRTVQEALAVAKAVSAANYLRLVGTEAFEGAIADDVSAEAFAAISELLARVRQVVSAVLDAAGFAESEIIVTAGGSAYFDLVVNALRDWPELSQRVTLILRSGCYVSQDLGRYQEQSPLAGRRAAHESLHLENALTLWTSVVSRPEPNLVIVGAGLRDAPVDHRLPTPRSYFRHGDGQGQNLRGVAKTFRVMDQHMFLQIPESLDLKPGDRVAFDLSHPCTAFDKFRLIPEIDDDYNVVDALLTYF
jgi:D-serine dehydratase